MRKLWKHLVTSVKSAKTLEWIKPHSKHRMFPIRSKWCKSFSWPTRHGPFWKGEKTSIDAGCDSLQASNWPKTTPTKSEAPPKLISNNYQKEQQQQQQQQQQQPTPTNHPHLNKASCKAATLLFVDHQSTNLLVQVTQFESLTAGNL